MDVCDNTTSLLEIIIFGHLGDCCFVQYFCLLCIKCEIESSKLYYMLLFPYFMLSLSGLSPFMGDNDNETLANVTSATWDFEDEAFDEISEEAKDFISSLLKKNMK